MQHPRALSRTEKYDQAPGLSEQAAAARLKARKKKATLTVWPCVRCHGRKYTANLRRVCTRCLHRP